MVNNIGNMVWSRRPATASSQPTTPQHLAVQPMIVHAQVPMKTADSECQQHHRVSHHFVLLLCYAVLSTCPRMMLPGSVNLSKGWLVASPKPLSELSVWLQTHNSHVINHHMDVGLEQNYPHYLQCLQR